MITIKLDKHSGEDVKLIQELRALGLDEETIQKAYDRTVEKREKGEE